MAIVSHYAMQRYSLGSDDAHQTQLHSSQHFLTAGRQVSPMYEKSKKTWSQRLKISKSNAEPTTKTSTQSATLLELPDFAPSALSRSMKYAEPWLYGTLRGIPVQPIFRPLPVEVAVVVCSCPEYLNGTKKEFKKTSICKKCKGPRLPLAPIGGTVRIKSTTAPVDVHKSRGSAGTMRLPTASTSAKSRPSILNRQNDPYDFMRRSRLMSPEPKGGQEKAVKSRAKSTSPARGRSRGRKNFSGEEQLTLAKSKVNNHTNQDNWVESHEPEPLGRRSILHCDVNPYDLISSGKLHNNEFAPDIDDIFDNLPKHPVIVRDGTLNRAVPKSNYTNIKAIAGQRISLGDSAVQSALVTQSGEKFVYQKLDNVLRTKQSAKQLNTEKAPPLVQHPKPNRPPRRKHDMSSTEDENETFVKLKPAGEDAGNSKPISEYHQSPPPCSPDLMLTSHKVSGGIKSILKRPASFTSSMSSSSDIDTKSNVEIHCVDSPTRLSGSTTSVVCEKIDTMSDSALSSIPSSGERISGSQFYLPFPYTLTPSHQQTTTTLLPRKKVQFMVNDEIICDDNEDNNTAVVNVEMNDHLVKDVTESGLDFSAEKSKQTAGENIASRSHVRIKSRNSIKSDDAVTVQDRRRYPEEHKTKPKQHTILNQHPQNEANRAKHVTENNGENKSVVVIVNNTSSGRNTVCKNHSNIKESSTVPGCCENHHWQHQHENGVSCEQGSTGYHINTNCSCCRDSSPALSNLRRTFSLRRTHSDRRNNTTSVFLNFNDTMALRTKHNRFDSRSIIFEDNLKSEEYQYQKQQHQSIVSRPREPPPAPPNRFVANQQILVAKSTSDVSQEQDLVAIGYSECKSRVRRTKTAKENNNTFDHVHVEDNKTRNDEGLSSDGESGQIPSRPSRQLPETTTTTINIQKKLSSWQENVASSIRSQPSSSSVMDETEAGEVAAVALDVLKNETINAFGDPADNKENSGTAPITIPNECFYEDFRLSLPANEVSVKQASHLQKNKAKFISDSNSNSFRYGQKRHHSHSHQEQQKQQHQLKKDKLVQAQKEIYHGTRLFRNQNKSSVDTSTSPRQKTVVRVAPFNESGGQEVHRLKIKHREEAGDLKCSVLSSLGSTTKNQKKTSILINGDDCYSTVNINNDDTPIYQSSVVVTDGTVQKVNCQLEEDNNNGNSPRISLNTVTISVSTTPRTPDEELIYNNNKINSILSLKNATKSVIPIGGEMKESNIGTAAESLSIPVGNIKRKRTLITLDYDAAAQINTPGNGSGTADAMPEVRMCHEEELVKILRNPVEAVKRNLVPHVCGKRAIADINADANENHQQQQNQDEPLQINIKQRTNNMTSIPPSPSRCHERQQHSFISKLLEDPTLNHLADGLESDVVAKLIEKSLKRLKESRSTIDISGTKDNDDMTKLIDMSLQRIREERLQLELLKRQEDPPNSDDQESQSNRGSVSSGNSFSSANYELFDFDVNNESDCYQSCSSELTTEDDANCTRSKFYQMLVDATLSEIEISANIDDHHYESIRLNSDPIYEEISEVPPPLPLSAPPLNDANDLEKKNSARSMFEGASKYDILSYLVDAKERGIVREESYEYNFGNTSDIIVEEEVDTLGDLNKKQIAHISSRLSHLSVASDSSEDASFTPVPSSLADKLQQSRKVQSSSEIERNDSGVGSETSKTSRSKYQSRRQRQNGVHGSCGGGSGITQHLSIDSISSRNDLIHLCEDCDGPVENQVTDSGVIFAPLVCRQCGKKRVERKEIITEIVETEEKYGRDLQIILEEFCQPMLVAGLLTQEQLSAIFLNTEELLENNQTLAERMRDALDIAMEHGDDDLLTVNVGKLFLDATPMLHAFESYCVRQAGASLLLANLEKDKELLRIFLRVSQMENTMLRRMNLNSFLMVPVQRVTKYPLLLARLYNVTPAHLEGREQLKQAQEKIELHLNHMNQEAKDVPTKLWRRISSSSPNRRSSCEIDMINIKLRKMAIDVLEWNHDEVRFTMEGKLLFTQPTDNNWKKGRTIKLTPVNVLLVTNGKPCANYKVEKALSEQLNFPKHTGIREASLLLVKEKCGRYTLIREPLYLDRCVVCTEADWDDYFEVQEISSKETFIFKAEDGSRTKSWYAQLQYHAQGMGAWRKRRNALANIMINGMLSRT